jgi:hypothetical protein
MSKWTNSTVLTTSKSQNLIEAFGYGLFPLNTPLISIRKCLLIFLCLGCCWLSRLLSSNLGSSSSVPGLPRCVEFGF